MTLVRALVSILSLVSLASAHFDLVYPDSRVQKVDTMSNYPCGGSPPSDNRTLVSLSAHSFPVAVKLSHSNEMAMEMLLALGTHPGANFNITLKPIFQLTGPGTLCLPNVTFDPSILGANVSDGMNATLQVQTNGDPTGGLYTCADIQFSSSTMYDKPPSSTMYDKPPSCKNGSEISASFFSGDAAKRHANESTDQGKPQSSSSPTSNAGIALETAAWGVLGAAAAGGIAIL